MVMQSRMRCLLLLAVVLLVLSAAISGCVGPLASRVGTEAGQAVRGGPPEESQPPYLQATDISTISPVDSGPGIVVCEPVVEGADPATADFATGCTRWLHLTVGGRPEFGRTPRWFSLERVPSELGRKDLRIGRTEAGQLASILGVTHVVVGEVVGAPGAATLSLAVLTVPESTPVGEPIVVSGTHEELRRQLPAVARRIATRLGADETWSPAEPALTKEELRLIGSLRGFPPFTMTQQDFDQLRGAGQKSALPSLYRNWYWHSVHGSTLSELATLFELADENALVWGEATRFAKLHPLAIPPGTDTDIEPLLGRHPDNAVLNRAATHLHLAAKRFKRARMSAAQAVTCNPADPESWRAWGQTVYETAHNIRQGRFPSDMTSEELEQTARLYERQALIHERAVELDPLYASGWHSLSTAAAFFGDGELAETALWESLELNPGDPSAYDWGLRLFRPEWHDDKEQQQRVAQLAATADYPYPSYRVRAAKTLHEYGFEKLALQPLRTAAERKTFQVWRHEYNIEY